MYFANVDSCVTLVASPYTCGLITGFNLLSELDSSQTYVALFGAVTAKINLSPELIFLKI